MLKARSKAQISHRISLKLKRKIPFQWDGDLENWARISNAPQSLFVIHFQLEPKFHHKNDPHENHRHLSAEATP